MKYFIILFLFIILGAGIYYVYENKDTLDIPYISENDDISELIEHSIDKIEKENEKIDEEIIVEVDEGELIKQGPLKIPEGFTIDIFAKNLGKVRVLETDPNGNILASILDEGRILLLNNEEGKLRSSTTFTLISGLNRPHGIALKCDETEMCKLFVAENDRVVVYDYSYEKQSAMNGIELFKLPTEGSHYTRSLEIINDNGNEILLTSIGSTCNVCKEEDWRNAVILSSDLAGKNLKPYSVGLRNTVFFEINPMTNELWGTEMGRDWLGDDLPPDEINIIKKNNDYGWPICYGKNIHDSDYDEKEYRVDEKVCNALNKTPSHIDLQAHSAPLGLEFIDSSVWNGLYENYMLVAQHGSWNRDEPVGYKVIAIELDESGNEITRNDFISGWLDDDDKVLGRPVDLITVDNKLFISDDKSGVIYVLKKED